MSPPHGRQLRGGSTSALAILEQPVIKTILMHLGLEPQPPSNAPAREPVPHHAG